MIEIKKKQTKIDWKLLSRITSGIIIFGYLLYALVIELTGMYITSSDNIPSSTITEAFGRVEICKRLDFLNTFGNKHIEAVASIVNQTFNQKGWKSPVKIYFDDEGDAFVKFSQDF